MRRTLLIPKADRLAGLICAFTHAGIVGYSLRFEYAAYYAGLDDPFDFHWLYWLYDLPLVTVADIFLNPLGATYRGGDMWSYVVRDTILLIAGTFYWFAVGLLSVRVLIPAIRTVLSLLQKIELDRAKSLRIVVLLLILVSLIGRLTNVHWHAGQILLSSLAFGLPLLAAIRALFELTKLCMRMASHGMPSPPRVGES